MQQLLLILGIPAIVLLFLPYTSGTSPLAAVLAFGGSFDVLGIALLGGPFFLAIVICIAQVRLFLKKSFPGTKRAIYWSLAYAALACGLALLTLGTWTEGFTKENIRLDLRFGIPFLVAVSLIVVARRLGPEKASAYRPEGGLAPKCDPVRDNLLAEVFILGMADWRIPGSLHDCSLLGRDHAFPGQERDKPGAERVFGTGMTGNLGGRHRKWSCQKSGQGQSPNHASSQWPTIAPACGTEGENSKWAWK